MSRHSQYWPIYDQGSALNALSKNALTGTESSSDRHKWVQLGRHLALKPSTKRFTSLRDIVFLCTAPHNSLLRASFDQRHFTRHYNRGQWPVRDGSQVQLKDTEGKLLFAVFKIKLALKAGVTCVCVSESLKESRMILKFLQ